MSKKEYKVAASYADSRRTHGMTNTEVAEAMVLYTEKLAKELTKKIIDDFEKRHNKGLDGMRPIVSHFMELAFDKGFTEGMKLGADTYILADFFLQEKERKAASLVQTYEFEEGKGISGILLPTGEFLQCGNAEHYLLVKDYPFEEQCDFLFFSSKRCGQNDGIVTHCQPPLHFGGLTFSMRVWLEENFKYLDREQQAYFEQFGVEGPL